MTKKVLFDLRKYTRSQIICALTDPLNRHVVRVRFGWDDWELYKHPEALLHNFVEQGGAREFAKRRKEFERTIEVPDPPPDPEYHI